MKITGIRQNQGVERELFIETEPPMTQALFDKFQELRKDSALSFRGNLLVWHGRGTPDKVFVQQTTLYLDEAEKALTQGKNAVEDSRKQFLEEASERTGLPLL